MLPVDAAPVPITLGNQDVLNAIENFKNTDNETDTIKENNSGLDDSNIKQDDKDTGAEKENKNKNNTGNTETTQQQSVPESPPTSPNKGSLVIVKHGIK